MVSGVPNGALNTARDGVASPASLEAIINNAIIGETDPKTRESARPVR
jgi:hypothetical protein